MSTDAPLQEAIRAAESFSLLANETRVAIVRELGNADPAGRPTVLSFSALRERVGMRDSGQFNYHLDTLLGEFVVEDDGGYKLNYHGYLAYQTMVRGTFEDPPSTGVESTEADCPECSGTLLVELSDGIFDLSCRDCDHRVYHAHFPPGGLRDGAPTATARTADQWFRHQISLMERGVCPWCAGTVECTLRTDDAPESIREYYPVAVEFTCEQCASGLFSGPPMVLLTTPAIVALFDDHGVDVREHGTWELTTHFTVPDDVGEPPVTVACSVAGDEVQATLDVAGTVTSVRRD